MSLYQNYALSKLDEHFAIRGQIPRVEHPIALPDRRD